MQETKVKSSGRYRVKTKFKDTSFIDVKALSKLEDSLAEGSKERLDEYRRKLWTDRGINRPYYDPKVEKLIKRYALNKKWVNQQISYLRRLTDEEGYLFSRNLKIYSKIEDAMRRFSEQDYTSFRWNENYQKSLEEMKHEFRAIHLNPLVYDSDRDIINCLPKKDTHSGFTWILTGNKEKGDNMENIHTIYTSEESLALQNGSFSKPILIGFRTQGSGEYDEEGFPTFTCKHKLRVVSMVDLIQILAEMRFSIPIQNYLGQCSYYAGGKNPEDIGCIISGFKTRNRKFISLDYSSYDQTISSWLIRDAFAILKEAFHNLTPEEDKLYEIVVQDFIIKDFVIAEGIVHSSKGVPSGSMFTQIIDSIVNRLMIKTYFHSLNEKASMIIMGDDNLIYTNADVDINLIASYIGKNFGIKVNPDKSSEGVSSKDDPEFLSCKWTNYGRWRNPAILLSKLLYSERNRRYSGSVGPEHVIFAAYLMYNLGIEKLINVKYFCADYPISKQFVMMNVDDRMLPGALAYIRNYTMRRNNRRIA